ncbi:uncharacterized protein C6orf136 homolog isoform X3 [Herpailurus yagouaroundi]|uniref:uncharacterized protein C6orf136 homolog isoform X3 n=1 Tax=Herpailurus yagouaroundi TaxID=1608482 RepID=UPI001AD73C9D|nr:uncharacterized protein C6orf136 homolog isoform X3 [Puma yagouaroundi]
MLVLPGLGCAASAVTCAWSSRIFHPDSGPGRKAGPAGPDSGPRSRVGKMATPPADTVPQGHLWGQRYLHGPPAFPDQLSPRALPFPPLWPHSTTTTSPSSILWSPPLPPPPIWLLPRAPPLPLPQIQALSSPWVVLPPGKGEEGPGPEMHSGCLDGLRSLFEGPPCPYPGALIPFQAPGTSCSCSATPSGDPSMEEHLAIMYERLRHELPNLFLHSHDYTLYSSDVEFINEILNIRTKTYDAYSTFFLNSNGLICRHRLDKLMPSHSPPTPVKKLLVGALVALGLSEPEPNLHLCSKT